MARLKEVFVCQTCGASAPKWQGQCPACNEWNTLLAEVQAVPGNASGRRALRADRHDSPASLAEEATHEPARLSTGSAELDRVLGGGLVAGSVTLIGGDPGIGKSTLMLQAAAALNAAGPVLYATGEESLQQVALRARRLGLGAAAARLIAETQVESIVETAASLKARALIVDSIQTMYSERIEAAPGAVSQLREGTAEFV
jgi:DNA repair protein RadA/Sms